MTRSFKRLPAMIAALCVTGAASGADTLTWDFSNATVAALGLEFFSQDRDRVWPGDGEIYILEPGEDARSYALSCDLAERICYGAWVRDGRKTKWGKGFDGAAACDECCAICGGGQPEPVTLSD